MELPSPKGFLYSVAKANIKYSDRYDMALIYSKKPAQAAGVLQQTRLKQHL